MWKDCGYLGLTKDGKKVIVVVKRRRHVVNLEEAKAVLEGKQSYTLIYEPSEGKKGFGWSRCSLGC